MSSTNGQPPLTRRQVRELERAREAGEAITGSISVVSGSPVPSAMPVTSPQPASSAPAPITAPAPGSASSPGRLAPTRRELRAQRAAEAPAGRGPVPLRAPQPENERNLSEALSHAADIQGGGRRSGVPTPSSDVTPPVPTPTPAATVASVPPREPEPASPSSPPQVDLPAPVTVDRRQAEVSIEPQAEADPNTGDAGESVPGPRRTGSTNSEAARVAVPAPSSTPTVFPFVLSGSGTSDASPATAPTVLGATESAAPTAAPAPAPAATADEVASPVVSAPVVSGSTPAPASAADRRQPSIPASVPEPAAYVPPTGHWSTQADVDDDSADNAGSHFGTVTGQQNALILDNDTLPDVTGALNATGEVIITGSIDLPRSLAQTGSHHIQRIDGADIDRLLEEGDREAPDNDAAPVRASRAVSANTSTRAVVLAAGKPKTNRAPLIASICAGVVFLVIVGLVVVGFVTHAL
ncbi:MAG: hypothetical protein JWP75_3945 [Frondihabitans sp.]|nr:hypothetical protein [Frondihabitans sp.]